MADQKITDLDELTSVAGTDLLAIVDDPSGTPITKNIEVDTIKSYISDYINSAILTYTNKTLTSPKINEDVALTSTATELNILNGVTSTAAELNILDGVTSTATELNILDGITSTTAELNILDGVTATYAEINTLDGAAGYVRGIQQGLTKPTVTSIVTTTTLVNTNAGYNPVILSGSNIELTMPALSFSNAGVIFLIGISAISSGTLTIEVNASDTGFVDVDGSTTGNIITFTGAIGDFVSLMSSGFSGGYWAIQNYYGVTLSSA